MPFKRFWYTSHSALGHIISHVSWGPLVILVLSASDLFGPLSLVGLFDPILLKNSAQTWSHLQDYIRLQWCRGVSYLPQVHTQLANIVCVISLVMQSMLLQPGDSDNQKESIVLRQGHDPSPASHPLIPLIVLDETELLQVITHSNAACEWYHRHHTHTAGVQFNLLFLSDIHKSN